VNKGILFTILKHSSYARGMRTYCTLANTGTFRLLTDAQIVVFQNFMKETQWGWDGVKCCGDGAEVRYCVTLFLTGICLESKRKHLV